MFPQSLLGFYFKHGVRPFFWLLFPWFFLSLYWRLSDGVLMPYLSKKFISLFEISGGTDFAPGLIVIIIGALIFAHIVHIIDDIIWVRLRANVSNHLSEKLHNYVQKQSMSFWTNRIVGKTNEQINFLTRGFDFLVMSQTVLAAIIIMTLNFGLLFRVNSQIAVVFGLMILFYFVHCGLRAKSIRDANKKYSKSASTLTGMLIDSLSNFQIVKLFSRQKYEQEYIYAHRKNVIRDLLNAGMMTRIFWGFPSIISASLFGVVLYLCVKLFVAGDMTASDIVFTLMVNTVIMHSVAFIVNDIPKVVEVAGAAMQSYNELIAPIEIRDAPNAKPLIVKNGKIEIKNLSFSYGKRKILNDLSLTINPGEKIGLVGMSGAGKTTLVNLLMRFYDPTSGKILIDGMDIKCITQDSLRENIAFIPQEPSMFNRTLGENIGYGRENATDEQILNAAKLASADKFINSSSDGFNTVVGDRGIKMSGGQRQRIAIARAFLKDAPILILDEATAALDSETESVIQKSFEKLANGRTTIAIAHRLSTLRNMDKIIVLNNGKIAEVGTHNELLKKPHSIYKKLWNMQSGGFVV